MIDRVPPSYGPGPQIGRFGFVPVQPTTDAPFYVHHACVVPGVEAAPTGGTAPETTVAPSATNKTPAPQSNAPSGPTRIRSPVDSHGSAKQHRKIT